jgi:hypothetical protein
MKLPTCIPYDEIRINPKFNKFKYADCGIKNLYSEAHNKIYRECKEIFAQEVCEASAYICVPEFAGDCEGVSGQELARYVQKLCMAHN